jgi:hypothetical protein
MSGVIPKYHEDESRPGLTKNATHGWSLLPEHKIDLCLFLVNANDILDKDRPERFHLNKEFYSGLFLHQHQRKLKPLIIFTHCDKVPYSEETIEEFKQFGGNFFLFANYPFLTNAKTCDNDTHRTLELLEMMYDILKKVNKRNQP